VELQRPGSSVVEDDDVLEEGAHVSPLAEDGVGVGLRLEEGLLSL
jgi:hypothetical protein